ncbi:transposase [Bradyrhizobium sp. sGM-13]|nr:transposase [Bradyrhizobium sp. sGM-13]
MGQALSGDRPGLAPRWEQVVPFFAFAPGVRKMIYTTNAGRGAAP